MINLGIVFGGKSVEHDISIITFNQIYNGVDKAKYNIIPIYLDKDNIMWYPKRYNKIEYFKDKSFQGKIITLKRKNNKVYVRKIPLDVVICTCHGKDLENGVISGYLKLLDIPNNLPSVYLSSSFHNKYITKALLKDNKIPVLNYLYVNKGYWENNYTKVINKIENIFKDKNIIVKPVSLGSSIGIKRIDKNDNIKDKINDCFLFDEGIIIEEQLTNFREFSEAVYKKENALILSSIEEVKTNKFYSFEEKYESNNQSRIVPANVDYELNKLIDRTTKKIYQIFDDYGVIRIDYLYDVNKKKLYVNEVNVIPGALSFYLFEAKKIYIQDFINDLVREAIYRNTKEKELITSFNSSVLDKSIFNKGSKF